MKKLKIENLKVHSFVTALSEEDARKLHGGVDTDNTPKCTGDCTTWCTSTYECPTADPCNMTDFCSSFGCDPYTSPAYCTGVYGGCWYYY